MIIISKISYYYYLKDMLCNCYSLYRLKLAVHCIRHPELLANDLVAWEPDARRGETKRGRPRQSYLSTLLWDVGINTKDEL